MDTRRFHSPQYKKQIKANRSYRRNVESRPEKAIGKFLQRIGLGSWVAQVVLLLVFAGLVYLVYFASFLRIKNITVQGATPDESMAIQSEFQDYFSGQKYNLLPQRNILFFNKDNFRNYLLKNDYKLSSVEAVQKKYFHTIAVVVNQRVPAFQLQTGTQNFILNSDGAISALAESMPAQDLQALPRIMLGGNPNLSLGDQVLDGERYNFISYFSENFKNRTGLDVDHFELLAEDSNQLYLITSKGFKIYFDMSEDPVDYLNKFLAIWSNISSDQQNKMFYVDMRFKSNAYLCYKGDKCAQ